jgi:hydrogenase/urease accessory protein HupE
MVEVITMGTRTRWIMMAGTFAVSAIIIGAAIGQAVQQHSMNPVWTVGWLPAVLAGVYPALTGRGKPAYGRCLPRLRRPAGS